MLYIKQHAENKDTNNIFSVITNNESEEWDEIVRKFNNYDVYYLSAYTKAFQNHGDGEPILFYFNDTNIKAINVVMKKDISLDPKFMGKIPSETYFDISTPYGYGGFLIEGAFTEESITKLNNFYSNYCKKEGIVSEFVRFHPVIENRHGLESIYNIQDLGKTITVNLESTNQIWTTLIGKNRNVIRKAQKANVEVHWGKEPKLIDKFIELYNATMNRDQAKDYYYFGHKFYQSILNDLKYNSMLFYATFNGEIIAMSMIMFANKQMHYHLSASNKEYQYLAPTNLLLFEAACWGAENEYETFHLGGGLGSEEDSLYKFKKAFNKESKTIFSIGKKIFDDNKYKYLKDIRNIEGNKTASSTFFPLYRL